MDLSDALGSNGAWPGQPANPTWPGQPANPTWPGQPTNPTWPGQPTNPTWPGQPSQPSGPAWPGQPGQPSQPSGPAWPGQPGQPSQPSQPSAPGWPSGCPQKPMTVPYDNCLPAGVFDKLLITIHGQAKPNAKMFTVDLSKGSDIALHFNVRFNDHGKTTIVRNSCIGGKWGTEERQISSFPFAPGRPFELKILCTSSGFRVAVDKSHLLEFNHRLRDISNIKHIGIYKDVTLSSVSFDKLP